MTTAPASLLAVRNLLMPHFRLDPASLGITGDPAHRGGYHCGKDRVISGDYSVVESARDKAGLADWACALDVGQHSARVAGKTFDLRFFSLWLVAQCRANTPDTRDIREIIYSPDGRTVKRWDRLGRRSSGDSSHLFHTHISYHRDAIKAGRDQTPVFRRYLRFIGLLAPAPTPPPKPAAEPTVTKEPPTMFMIKRSTADTVYLSWGTGRAALTDYAAQMKPLQTAGVPMIVVKTDAELDVIGGPLRADTAPAG